MKKLFLLFAVLAAFTISAKAEDFAVANSSGVTIYYNITDATELTVEVTYDGNYTPTFNVESVWYTGVVKTPSTVTYDGVTYSVTSIGSQAFYGCSGLTSINISSGVTDIQSAAFRYCTALTNVILPSTLTSIGDHAFHNCSFTTTSLPDGLLSIGNYAFWKGGLTKITLPNGLKSIGNYAFSDCEDLTYISIPGSVETIGDYVFYSCYSLATAVVSEGVTSLGTGTFSQCQKLTKVTLPSTLTELPERIFYYCRALLTVTLPDGIPTIPSYAFNCCTALTSVNIPESVTSFGTTCFTDCANLETVYFDAINCADFESESGYYGFSNARSLKLKYMIIGENVQHIPAYLCYGGINLPSIDIPNSVDSIGAYAFYNCSAASSISIGEGVTSIGDAAFTGCSGASTLNFNAIKCEDLQYSSTCKNGFYDSPLKTVNIGEQVENIPGYLAYLQADVTSITIPESVTHIGKYAFRGLSFPSITIPENVTSIGKYSFLECLNLDTLSYNAISCEDDIEFCFTDCPLLAVKIGDKVEIIPKNFMNGYKNLTSIVIPDAVTTISERAFYYCEALDSITIGKSVKLIDTQAFALCYNISKVTFRTVTPPASSSGFGITSYSVPFYVPMGSVEAYKSHDYWYPYNIIGVDMPDVEEDEDDDDDDDDGVVTAIATVKTNEIDFIQDGNTISFTTEQLVSVYSINGVCVFSGVTRDLQLTSRGIYVVVTTSGATKIII